MRLLRFSRMKSTFSEAVLHLLTHIISLFVYSYHLFIHIHVCLSYTHACWSQDSVLGKSLASKGFTN
ncbi:hypothetical protein T492DRAFT_955481 [Pavlovales sp. CCMP2436]|nr:hypothetical protein T492DRAFT_955481 [Pavlovales sp. CCMP2436]